MITKTYTITVYRESGPVLSGDATLANLTLTEPAGSFEFGYWGSDPDTHVRILILLNTRVRAPNIARKSVTVTVAANT